MAGTKQYELAADRFTQVTSKPGEPIEFTEYVKGDKVTVTEQRAKELIAAGALVDPNADSGSKPGGETVAPKGRAPGVGDGDADAGSIGDGGPDPQGTGSTVVGDGGSAGDGQGSADGNPSSTSDQGTGSSGRSRSRGSRSS